MTIAFAQVLWPRYNVRHLVVWSEVYLGSTESLLRGGDIKDRVPVMDTEGMENVEPRELMTKTRSYSDFTHAPDHTAQFSRRLSDPSISMEK